MSEPVAPGYPQPPVPPKKSKTGKIILIVVIALVVVCGGIGLAVYFLFDKAVDAVYSEGNCVDSVQTSATATSTAVPTVVSCSDSKAAGKILKVADDKSVGDAEAVCGSVPGVTSYTVLQLQGNKTKLLCIGPVK